MRKSLACLTLLLAACSVRNESDDKELAPSICEPLVFEQTPFTHCTAQPQRHFIGTDLAPEGETTPYRSLDNYRRDSGKAAKDVVLVMNGGMFDGEGMPIGYYVEDGRRLVVLNQNDGPGNFHMMPNGVFFGETADGPWHVWDTDRFAENVEGRPNFATQSGPMLVINGELHPRIDPDGISRKTRNAVGVDDAGRAHFIISEAPVSFGKLARLYRDVLRVENAVFLDGSVSQIWDPANARMDRGPQIGPLLVVGQREDAE